MRPAIPRAVVVLTVLAAALSVQASAPQEPARTRRVAVDDRSIVTLEASSHVYMEVQAEVRDSYVSLAMRYTGSERHWAALERANDGRPVKPGFFYAIPFDLLVGQQRVRTLLALFPADGLSENGWVHRVPATDPGQSLASVALWFTGTASLADDLAESNGIEWAPLEPGAEVVIPSSILMPEFFDAGKLVSPLEPPVEDGGEEEQPAPPPVASKPAGPVKVGDLTFMEEDGRALAIYRLKRGEALYSSVVVKFTGRLDPDEVTTLAEEVARLSGIRSMTSIPVGYAVKIPRDQILPDYLPPDDPKRVAYEKDLAEAGRHSLTVRARDLEGVSIILDAGHGGDDVGAQRNGVHEDDYVYDIMVRIKQLAEKETAAKVLVTIRDKSAGDKPHKGPFRIDKDEYILTTPRYHPRKPHAGTVGVNLRWYLVNSYYRSLLADGADPQRVVFVSIHADSLHPSVRGAMVYVPGQAYRRRTYGHSGRLYNRKEVGELRYVKFSRSERVRSEGLSRKLAETIIDAFETASLPVHKDKPIRDHVIRGRRNYTPAVIRTSKVPQSVLLEVVNLNNKKDAKLIRDPDFRQRVAEAFLDALRKHYSRAPAGTTTTAASGS